MLGRWTTALGGLLALTTAAACGGGSNTKRATPTAGPAPAATIDLAKGAPLKIGVSAALSGDEMSLGADIADAVLLAANEGGGSFKGHPLTVERMDDGCSDAEKAVSAARALVADAGVAGVVGPMCTTGAQAADSLYESWHVVHILPSATRADLSQQGEQFFFRTAWLDDAQADVQATYMLQVVHATSAIVIDDAEPYGKTLGDAFVAAFEAGGGTTMSRQRIERGDTDFAALARQVKGANPDIVVFEGLNPEGALLIRALRKAGYAGAYVAPDGVLNAHDFIAGITDNTGATAADGAIVTGGPTPGDAFNASFQAAYQRAPSTPFVLQAHDAAAALLKALETVATERADGTMTIDRVRLAETLRAQGLDGLTGKIRFDQHGDRQGTSANEAGLTIYRVVNGTFEPVP
jgi:branched-chain amino acid transport system substrate-binding protein